MGGTICCHRRPCLATSSLRDAAMGRVSRAPVCTETFAAGMRSQGICCGHSTPCRDPASPAYLTRGMQEIRDVGNPAHLALQAKTGNRCRIVVIHGEDDNACPAADKRRAVDAMRAAGLAVDAHFLTQAEYDKASWKRDCEK